MQSYRLIAELEFLSAPLHIIVNARAGLYDPRLSPLVFPKIALLIHLRDAKLHDLALRVINGEFD